MRLTIERLAATVVAGQDCRDAFLRLAEGVEKAISDHLEDLPKSFLSKIDVLINDAQIRPAATSLVALAVEEERLRTVNRRAEKNRIAVAEYRARKKAGKM